MTELRRRPPDPLVTALRLALEEVAVRRAADRAEQRRTLTVVDGGRRTAA